MSWGRATSGALRCACVRSAQTPLSTVHTAFVEASCCNGHTLPFRGVTQLFAALTACSLAVQGYAGQLSCLSCRGLCRGGSRTDNMGCMRCLTCMGLARAVAVQSCRKLHQATGHARALRLLTVGPEQGVLCHELLGQHGPLLEVVDCETHVLQELLNCSVGGPGDDKEGGCGGRKGVKSVMGHWQGHWYPHASGTAGAANHDAGKRCSDSCASSYCVVSAALLRVFCSFCSF